MLTHSDPYPVVVGKSAGTTRLVLPATNGNLRNHLQREDPSVAEPGSSHRHPRHSGSLVSDTGIFGTLPRSMLINRWVPNVLRRKGGLPGGVTP